MSFLHKACIIAFTASLYKYAQWPAYLPPSLSSSLLLSSACRSSAWWPRRWCRDTRSFSLNVVSKSRHGSISDWSCVLRGVQGGKGVGGVNDCQSQGHVDSPEGLYFSVTHKRMMTVILRHVSLNGSVWNQSLCPCRLFCHWNAPWGICG